MCCCFYCSLVYDFLQETKVWFCLVKYWNWTFNNNKVILPCTSSQANSKSPTTIFYLSWRLNATTEKRDTEFSSDMITLVSPEPVGCMGIDNHIGVPKNADKFDTMAAFRVPCLKQIWVYRYRKLLLFLFIYIGDIGIPFLSKLL